MNMEEKLRFVVETATSDSELWHSIIHGDKNTIIQTENGNVPSVAKQLSDVRDEVIGGAVDYLESCQTLKNQTEQIKIATLTIKNETASLKSDTLEFRNETEGFKNLSQTTFNNISTATSTAVSTVQTEGQKQVALAKEQADRAHLAMKDKADTNLSNVSKNSGLRKLIEMFSNDSSWHKVYEEINPVSGVKSKWCEQGGVVAGDVSGGERIFNVTFSKPFINTPILSITFVASRGLGYNLVRSLSNTGLSARVKSTSDNYQNYASCHWFVQGYIN